MKKNFVKGSFRKLFDRCNDMDKVNESSIIYYYESLAHNIDVQVVKKRNGT